MAIHSSPLSNNKEDDGLNSPTLGSECGHERGIGILGDKLFRDCVALMWLVWHDKVQLPLMRHFYILVMDGGQFLYVKEGFVNVLRNYIILCNLHNL